MEFKKTNKDLPKNRDVSFIKLDEDLFMVVACDSAGGIGEKEKDVVKVSPHVLGRFTLRVALMEVMAVGAAPGAVTAAICCEPSPTGEGIIAGIKDELKSIELNLPIVISTEKNMPTCQTGLGVTVIGTVNKKNLRINKTKAGDKIYCIGIPRVGNEVSLNDPDIADSKLVKELLNLPSLHDIIPVGSKGVNGEVQSVASYLGLSIKWESNLPVDIKKSAGPSTCVIVTCPKETIFDFRPPSFFLGRFI